MFLNLTTAISRRDIANAMLAASFRSSRDWVASFPSSCAWKYCSFAFSRSRQVFKNFRKIFVGGVSSSRTFIFFNRAHYSLENMLTCSALMDPICCEEHGFLSTGGPGYISVAPKVLLNLSSMTNFEIKPQIREAFLDPTASKRGESISLASRKITWTPVVSEKGFVSSKPFPNCYKNHQIWLQNNQ